MKQRVLPAAGRIVEITKGREAGAFAVVVGHVGDRFVLLADGQRRKVDDPKKKNVLHIRVTPYSAGQFDASLGPGTTWTTANVRHVMKQFMALAAEQDAKLEKTAIEEGGVPSGER